MKRNKPVSSKTLPSRRLRTQKANRSKRKRRRKESSHRLQAGLAPTAQIATLRLSLRPRKKLEKRPRRTKKQIRLRKVRARRQRNPKVSHKQRRVPQWRTMRKRRKRKSASSLLPGKLEVCRSLQGQRAG